MRLTNAQWDVVEDFIPEHERNLKNKGRPWVSPRKILDGILWIVKTGARWCDLPKNYPSYQTCHRRFQKWVHAGVFEKIIKSLVQDLEKRGKINLTETYIDATYVDAQKGGLKSAKPNAAMGPRSWQSQTISLFLSPLAYRVLHDMRVHSLIKQLGPALQLTFLRELWVTKHTILIHLTGTSERDLKSKSLLPISSIENVKQLKMADLFEDTKEDGELSDFLPGFSLFDESKFDMNDLMKIS